MKNISDEELALEMENEYRHEIGMLPLAPSEFRTFDDFDTRVLVARKTRSLLCGGPRAQGRKAAVVRRTQARSCRVEKAARADTGQDEATPARHRHGHDTERASPAEPAIS